MTVTGTQRSALHRTYAWSVNAAIGAGRDGLADELAADFSRQTVTGAPHDHAETAPRSVRRPALRPFSRRSSA